MYSLLRSALMFNQPQHVERVDEVLCPAAQLILVAVDPEQKQVAGYAVGALGAAAAGAVAVQVRLDVCEHPSCTQVIQSMGLCNGMLRQLHLMAASLTPGWSKGWEGGCRWQHSQQQ
jgi:hypothetical protein